MRFRDRSFVPSTVVAPIALRKGRHVCTFHPIAQFVSYDYISPLLCAFTTSVSSVYIPQSVQEALCILG